jgi:hypothetical protein
MSGKNKALELETANSSDKIFQPSDVSGMGGSTYLLFLGIY